MSRDTALARAWYGARVGFVLFGLTGGIASGKSTVAAHLRARGVPVIDADQVARDVVAPGTDGLAALVDAFGPGILDASGALDRKKMAAIAFADEAARRKLESITHPRIGAASMSAIAAEQAKGHELVGYEAALLVEGGRAELFRPLVVVTAPRDVQVERAMARDACSRADAEARLAAQLPMEEKARAADFVIENTGSRDELVRRADEVLAALRARAAKG